MERSCFSVNCRDSQSATCEPELAAGTLRSRQGGISPRKRSGAGLCSPLINPLEKQPMDMNEFNKKVIEDFHANGGKVGGQFAGAPMMLLTTKGAKSGKTYINPLVYTRDGDRIVIIASKAGSPKNPDWYHNLVAHPEPTVEIGTERFQAKATVTSGTERERLFDQQAKLMPQFNEYRSKTTRQIPVIVLERLH